jgi:DNA-binding GntR family transcriptional regulator
MCVIARVTAESGGLLVTVDSADSDSLGVPTLMPAASVSRRDAVIRQIKRGIVLGTLKPGEKLTESYLSSALGVSRPTVREALNQVAQEGLLIQEPYRGLRVADLDTAAVLDMADVRVALDMQAAEAILEDQSGRRMKKLMAAWAAYERDAFADDELVLHESHLAFHRGIWAASGELVPDAAMAGDRGAYHHRARLRPGHPARSPTRLRRPPHAGRRHQNR